VLEPGVTGPEFRGKGGSEFWRSRWDKPNKSPKLFRPVEVEVRVDASVGVGNGSSLSTPESLKELRVDERPRTPSIARVGEDRFDAADPCLINGGPPNVDEDWAAFGDGDGNGDANPWISK
jgi:hypothetical protein